MTSIDTPPALPTNATSGRPRAPKWLIGTVALVGVISMAATSVSASSEESTSNPESTSTTTIPSTTTTVAPEPTVVTDTENETEVTTTVAVTADTVPAATTTTTTTPPPPAPAPMNVIAYPEQIANVLATIRYMESRGNYTLPPNKGNASGAYQFIASTWAKHGGYAHSYLAPPAIQDERAAIDVTRFLAQWNNDVSMIPVMWYYPRAAREVALMDIVPVPSAGNVLTVREYQQRWLGVWAFLSGQPIPQSVAQPVSIEDAVARFGVPPDPATVAEGGQQPTLAFPVLGPSRLAGPDCGDGDDQVASATADSSIADIAAAGLCAEQAPGIVFGVKLQPVLSVVDGIVTSVVDQPGLPISVTLTDDSGRSYTLAGFNDDNPGTNDGAAPDHLRLGVLARVGGSVRAGQVLGFMGDTDPLPLGVRADVPTDATVDIATDAVAPHIRLTINELDGTPVDAYGPVIDALFRQLCSVGTGPWSSPTNGLNNWPVTIETTDNDDAIDSEWVITSTGQVTASGWAAMIYPNEFCKFTPHDARGPGAGGLPDVPWSWLLPIDLPTSVWIELALQADGHSGVALLRP